MELKVEVEKMKILFLGNKQKKGNKREERAVYIKNDKGQVFLFSVILLFALMSLFLGLYKLSFYRFQYVQNMKQRMEFEYENN